MSMIIKTTNGEELYVNLQPFSSQILSKQQTRKFGLKALKEGMCGWYLSIGDYEIPLEDFCAIAGHYMGGGIFGWGDGRETPEPVNEALTHLFGTYSRKNGKWVLKTSKQKQRRNAVPDQAHPKP